MLYHKYDQTPHYSNGYFECKSEHPNRFVVFDCGAGNFGKCTLMSLGTDTYYDDILVWD